jgi:hypothetical protein
MSRKKLSLAVSLLAMLGTVGQTAAGGRAVECYEPYRTEPVYGTVLEHVEVNPGYSRVETTPAIVGTRRRAVLVAPERVDYEILPAIVRTEYRTVRIGGGYGWEWRVIHGRRVLCKVWHKTRYNKLAETVVVRPEHRRRIVIPARYETVVEQVVIQPEFRRVVDVPPSYRRVARHVLVREGQSGWRRVHIPRHCGY